MIRSTSGLKYSHIVITGDFNLPDINWKHWATKSVNPSNLNFKFVECLRDTFMFQHVSNPTRGRDTTNTNLLDLILSNEEDNIGEIGYLSPLGKSDHCVITFNILCKVITNKYTKKQKLFNKANYEEMRKEFSDIDWEEKFKDCKDNVNDQWEILKTLLKLLEDKYVPQKEVSNYRKGNFPLNANTRKLIRRKNRLWTRYIETRDGTKYLEY